MMDHILNVVSVPQLIWLFVFLSVTTIIFFLRKKKDKIGIRYGSSRDLTSAKSRARNLTAGLLAASIAITLSLGFVLTTGSSESISVRECKNKELNRRDTMIVVDISGSMVDTVGTNFKLARSTLLRTLGANPEENIGLVFFSDAAFAPIAPTNCHAVFVTLIHEDLYKTPMFKDFVSGTNGSAGINVAINLLEQSNAKTKRIVFIGDLQDNDSALFTRTLKQVWQNGIQEIELMGVTASTSSYEYFESYGIDVILIANEADAEKVGPLPRDINNIEKVSFSSQLSEQQIVSGFIVFVAVLGIIILNFYVRRPLILRRKK